MVPIYIYDTSTQKPLRIYGPNLYICQKIDLPYQSGQVLECPAQTRLPPTKGQVTVTILLEINS